MSRLLERQDKLFKAGFQRILALRDIFDEAYKKRMGQTKIPNHTLNEERSQAVMKEIQLKSQHPQNIHFHFAIMEVEAWFLGLHKCFITVDSRLTPEFIQQNCGFNLESCNPETAFLHPKETVKQILKTVNQSYKEAETPKTLLSNIEKSDFQMLSDASICNSFTNFYQTITTN